MSFSGIEISRSYKTNHVNIVREFFIPVMKESILYKRAVGFFSSTALIDMAKGISGLIKNGGMIKFIVSPYLSEEDVEAIKRGYDARKVVEESLTRAFVEPQNSSDIERLNWLANLIASEKMEIKVAFTMPQKNMGMYHEKIGVVYDNAGNKLAFTGSLNETYNAYHNNYESIVVFNSMVDSDQQRVTDIEHDFDSLWSGGEPNVEIMEFPTALNNKLLSYKKPDQYYDLDKDEFEEIAENNPPASGIPFLPKGFKFHKYQDEAIDTWELNNYQGIFDMATGTGKTYTGLGAVLRLFNHTKKLATVIVCPYQHLVDQWVEDIEYFNIKPVIGYSASRQANWKERLTNEIMDFRLGIINFMCFVTTNATFSSEFVQKQLSKLKTNTLIVVDEAHNFGASRLRNTLPPHFHYRLALSATLERHNDPDGTAALFDYFGKKCIEYSLERAIREDKLTPYYYYPKIVYLTAAELDKYRELSRKIAKMCYHLPSGEISISEAGKKLLIERARLIAGAENKVELLKKLMYNYTNESHILVYCGAARKFDDSKDSSENDEEGERQIVSVSKMLGKELGMKVTHFTSNESAAERDKIKKQFAEANPYQAIVAIKCLDEGVNIPSIKTAFILASSTNPKEYIQRRGRVLRKFPGKSYATIYDFITLPRPLDYVADEGELARMELSLIKNEIRRMKEFGEIAKNPADADRLINELVEAYSLDSLDCEEGIIDG